MVLAILIIDITLFLPSFCLWSTLKSSHNCKIYLKENFVMSLNIFYQTNPPNFENKAWITVFASFSLFRPFVDPFLALGAPKNDHTPMNMVSNDIWRVLLLHNVHAGCLNRLKKLTKFWDMFSITIHGGSNILKYF